MSTELLTELKKLQHQRSDSSPFADHVDFNTWADNVLPLVSFNQTLYNRFRSIVAATNTARSFGNEQQELENINTAIGILNQAVGLLEVPKFVFVQQPDTITKSAANLDVPQKVTVKWLYEHVPVHYIGAGIILLVSAFSFGIAFTEVSMYTLIKSTIINTVPVATNQNATKIDNESHILPLSTK